MRQFGIQQFSKRKKNVDSVKLLLLISIISIYISCEPPELKELECPNSKESNFKSVELLTEIYITNEQGFWITLNENKEPTLRMLTRNANLESAKILDVGKVTCFDKMREIDGNQFGGLELAEGNGYILFLANNVKYKLWVISWLKIDEIENMIFHVMIERI